MFQRIKGAIDRTIAEEQARQKSPLDAPGTSTPPTGSSRRTGSVQGRRTKGKNASTDLSESAAPNPDPAVFEAAFVIDDSDEPSRTTTPKPVGPGTEEGVEKDGASQKATPAENGPQDADAKRSQEAESSASNKDDASSLSLTLGSATSTLVAANNKALSPEIKQRLRKLEKLENTYPELLRSYRVAHKRATAIEPFEKALRENTPLTSIGDPDALIEYLNQLNLRGDMVMDELKRVSADKKDVEKQHEVTQGKLKQLQAELDTIKEGKQHDTDIAAPDTTTPATAKKTKPAASPAPADGKPPPAQDDAQDFFSYDDEIPQLQAEISSKSEQIETLKSEVDDLKRQLSAVQESSAGLVENLENATRELSESRDASASQSSLQADLDARTEEITTLKGKLEMSEARLKELEAKAEAASDAVSKVKEIESSRMASEQRIAELQAEAAKAVNAKSISKRLIDDLQSQVEILKKESSTSQNKADELAKLLESRDAAASEPVDSSASRPFVTPTAAASGGTKKKNNKKKKGKTNTGTTAAIASNEDASKQGPGHNDTGTSADWQICRLKEEIAEKDTQIENLSKRRQTEDDLREEIESLQDDLVHIGQDHVEAKEKIKVLEEERSGLKTQIAELEHKLESLEASNEQSGKLQGDLESLQIEHDELRDKSASLQSDLEAAHLLAQSRFKELTELREILQKAQPEIKSLREESATLKSTKEDLAAKVAELKEMENKSKELRREVTRAQQLASDRDAEVKNLQSQLASESEIKVRLEETQRTSLRNLKRAETERVEALAKLEKAERELQRARDEIGKLLPRVKELEDQMHKLKREKTASQEEVEFKAQQYKNAQNLLNSMREQSGEIAVQLKESKSQTESLEEELAEVQRLLQERTREGETMRHLLADVDERADGKVREMRARMEAAVEERERVEDEASVQARRRARESEELKQKVRELEREVKSLKNERDELEGLEREWKRKREELQAVESKAEAEMEEMRTTVSQLRSALDASEGQVRDGEKQRADLRKMLDDSQQRYQKLAKDLKTAQTRLVANSGRSSTDSNRSGVNGGAASDTAYLKTVLLQFLEQKDGKLRTQLVPVLGKLLKFDKTDEQKWINAVQRIDVR